MSAIPRAKRASRPQVPNSEAELLDRILARRHLSRQDARHADHCKAAIADLLLPGLLVVHADAEGIAKVASLHVGVILPLVLHYATPRDDREEAHLAKQRVQGADAGADLLS